MEKIQKNDFIQLEFTAKVNDNIFDTNISEDAEKAGLKEVKPFILSVGHSMIIPGLDKSLEGKEINKEYQEVFQPEHAFGKRNLQLIKMIPERAFREQKIIPQAGMQLNLDGRLAKIISASGGRILVDFNNPLSGKKVEYKFKAVKKITDENEKINALQDFFFSKRFDFIPGNPIIFNVEEKIKPFIELMSKPFKDILGKEVKVEEKKEEKHTTKPHKSLKIPSSKK